MNFIVANASKQWVKDAFAWHTPRFVPITYKQPGVAAAKKSTDDAVCPAGAITLAVACLLRCLPQKLMPKDTPIHSCITAVKRFKDSFQDCVNTRLPMNFDSSPVPAPESHTHVSAPNID